MSLFDYRASQQIAQQDWPFYALVMAAYRQADTRNADLVQAAWPDTVAELRARYNAPGGLLATDSEIVAAQRAAAPDGAAAECCTCGHEVHASDRYDNACEAALHQPGGPIWGYCDCTHACVPSECDEAAQAASERAVAR